MSIIRIHTRSFHPGKTFGSSGLGFSGDDRGFSHAPMGVTSRIRHYFDIDLTGAKLISSRPVSDPSHHEGMGTTQRYTDPAKQPTSTISGSVLPYRADGDQRFEATISYKGKNYAFPGADWEQNIPGTDLSISPRHGIRRTVPDLDVTHTVSGHIDRTSRKLHITSDLRGDGFPNSECFALDDANAPLFLCSHIRVGVAAAQLFGDRKLPMGRAQLEADISGSDTFESQVLAYSALDYAGDGSPVDLIAGRGTGNMSRQVWNLIHTSRDAMGPESRRQMDNNMWEGLKERFGW